MDIREGHEEKNKEKKNVNHLPSTDMALLKIFRSLPLDKRVMLYVRYTRSMDSKNYIHGVYFNSYERIINL